RVPQLELVTLLDPPPVAEGEGGAVGRKVEGDGRRALHLAEGDDLLAGDGVPHLDGGEPKAVIALLLLDPDGEAGHELTVRAPRDPRHALVEPQCFQRALVLLR